MKRYLKTPEEVIVALKEGKTVKCKDCGAKYTLENGFLVEKSKGTWTINPPLYGFSGYYTEEPDELELEVGKFYKTRDGRKAFVYAKTDFDYPYRFCVAMVGNLESYSVNAKGTQSDIEQRPVDLIAHWGNK